MAEGRKGQREEERCVLTRQESKRANCTLETLANPLLSHTSDHEGGAPWLTYFPKDPTSHPTARRKFPNAV